MQLAGDAAESVWLYLNGLGPVARSLLLDDLSARYGRSTIAQALLLLELNNIVEHDGEQVWLKEVGEGSGM